MEWDKELIHKLQLLLDAAWDNLGDEVGSVLRKDLWIKSLHDNRCSVVQIGCWKDACDLYNFHKRAGLIALESPEANSNYVVLIPTKLATKALALNFFPV